MVDDETTEVLVRKPEEEQKEKGGAKEAKVEVPWECAGVYTAVMAAAFGGVRVKSGAKEEERKVYPCLLLILCFPVFLAQVNVLLFLRSDFDIELDEPIYSNSTMGDVDSPTGDKEAQHAMSLLHLKLLMVSIIYIKMFKTLYSVVYQCAFIFNPMTWVEVARPKKEDWAGANLAFLFTPAFLMPVTACAVLMRFCVCYLVCADSVSIIMSDTRAKYIILDSVAIGFVLEFCGIWWEFCSYIFRFSPIGSFKFSLWDETWNDEGDIRPEKRNQLLFPGIAQALVGCTRRRDKHSWLRVGKGADKAMQIITLLSVALLYGRQYLIVLHAVDTNVFPAARDMCTLYNLEHDTSWTSMLWNTFEKFLLVSVNEEIDRETETIRDKCDSSYSRLTVPQMLPLVAEYSIPTACVVALFALVMASTLWYVTESYWGDVDEPERAKTSKGAQVQIDALKKQIEELTSQSSGLAEQLNRQCSKVSELERNAQSNECSKSS